MASVIVHFCLKNFLLQAEPDHGVNAVFVKLGDTKIEVSLMRLQVAQYQISCITMYRYFVL